MCFSAEADLVSGSVVGIIGIGAMRHVRRPEQLALGAVPVVLGAHLLVEAPVWWGQTGQVEPDVAKTAAALYLLIALVLLPVLVPAALWAVESPGRRKAAMATATALGGLVAAVYLFSLVRGPIGVEVDGRHLVYVKVVPGGGVVAAAYVAVTCGPLLLSSYRRVVEFGVLNLLAVGILDWVARNGLTSLWCAWAAVTSVMISAHLKIADEAPGRGLLWAGPRGRGDGALA